MKVLVLNFLIILLIPIYGCAQNVTKANDKNLNLDFENIQNGYPAGWTEFGEGDYKVYIDSSQVKMGKNSVVMESTEGNNVFKALEFKVPNNYQGKSILLKGSIKTEDVKDGYAGLWMRIDPQIAFDNMGNRGVKGTTNWQDFEIKLPLKPEKTPNIVFGGILVGKGKMWLDNLQISIDGKILGKDEIDIYEKELFPADKDKEFDNGSNITFPKMTDESVSNLELLGRIWGFMKYHHPEIAKGNYNWDYELFRVLPQFLNAKNNQGRDQVIKTWIEKYGKIPTCTNCKPSPESAVLKPDLSWIQNSNLSSEVKAMLNDIYNNRNQNENYYIKLHPNVSNPDFTNEKAYSNMPYPDAGFRLLALYKYWNMMNYFNPNKHLTEKDWDKVLKEYIPGFLNAKNELEYELVALQIIADVKDTHANLWSGGDKIQALRGKNFAPFKAEFIEDKLVVVDYYNLEYADQTKLKVGDYITHINGNKIESIVDSLERYYPSSNSSAMLRDISADILRSTDSSMKLKYVSDGKKLEHEIPLIDRGKLKMYYMYKVNNDEKSYKIMDGNIGYITLANIKNEDFIMIKKTLKDTKGIIIDIRNYPSSFAPFALGTFFMSKPTSFVKFTFPNPKNPGEFTFSNPVTIQHDPMYYKGKLVILVNEKSQSQAEYTAMAFKAVNNSKIVGSTTAGADGNVSEILLPGGLRTLISGIGIYYPDGTETQRIGIVPDVIVKPTIEGIKANRDEVLEKAVELINN
ncbi:S41 family peptidase [Sphingobacterium daejeonense]|uniref:S41 family peptidase n=1 Tax=Sphingobacterium daejeonense TaxID=371142 RepID=UPI0021A600DC|nr:S41 family peptidase [Sphingobacterium daejeonense]MCT1530178.1 S41 family peptidase [Sphingobacterium daejeonense]